MAPETRTVKVARVGGKVEEYEVQPSMTVGQLLETADLAGESGTVYGVSSDGTSRAVESHEPVNGFTKLVMTTDVKGGC